MAVDCAGFFLHVGKGWVSNKAKRLIKYIYYVNEFSFIVIFILRCIIFEQA